MIHVMDSRKSPERVVQNLQMALEMYGLGESMMRQKLCRSFPQASQDEIEMKLWEWLSHHPGAEKGDAPGRLRDGSE